MDLKKVRPWPELLAKNLGLLCPHWVRLMEPPGTHVVPTHNMTIKRPTAWGPYPINPELRAYIQQDRFQSP